MSPSVVRGLQVAAQHLARVALERRAVEVVDVAEHPGLGRLRVAPRQHLERVRVGDREDVALLDAAEAVDRRAVEGHAVLERVLQLGGADRKALQVAEHVGEPQADEAHAALLHRVQHVVALLFVHGHRHQVYSADREPSSKTDRGRAPRGRPARSALVRSRRSGAADRVGDEAGDRVRIAVGVRAAVFGVALAVLGDLPRDADPGAAVGHAVAELVVRGGLVLAGEAALDVVAVALDVQVDLACRSPRRPPRWRRSPRASPWSRSWCAHRRRSSRPSPAWRRS